MAKSKEFIFGGSMLVAAIFGYFVESNTNDVAAAKVKNVNHCIAEMGHRTVMDEADLACIAVSTDVEKLPVGTTKAEMQEYVVEQQQEAAHIELGRIGGWAFAGATELVWPTIIYQAIT